MKKTIYLIGCFAMTAWLLSGTSCKRNDLNQPGQSEATVTVQPVNPAQSQTGRESADLSEPTGIAYISEALSKELHGGKFIEAKVEGEHKYRARNVINIQPYDPCAQDWANFNAYYNSILPQMKALANQTCEPVYGAWSGVCIACVLFVVYPDYPPCAQVAVQYQSALRVHEGGQGIQEPTGLLDLSQDHFDAMAAGKYLGVDKVADHRYKAINIIDQPGGPYEPYDPCAKDWDNFRAYINAHKAVWQAQANATCRPVRGCWCGECVCIAFEIRPTIPCDIVSEYEHTVRVYEGSLSAARH